jgi:4a-hydroxytetrahydrobiopterin dehydratase
MRALFQSKKRRAIMSLAEKHCVPCRGGIPPLAGAELATLLAQVPGWQVVGDHDLRKVFTFPDFRKALDFVNRVGEVAETEGHHPDLFLAWGRVEVKIWTHKIDGLTESDFILAAKIDGLSAQ